mgnify:CR=1 FL=1
MTSYDHVRAHRVIWAERLFRMGELPAKVEVIAVQGTATEDLGTARQAVRDMADEDGTPIKWLGQMTVQAVSEDKDVIARRAREDALKHGMSLEELPRNLRRED